MAEHGIILYVDETRFLTAISIRMIFKQICDLSLMASFYLRHRVLPAHAQLFFYLAADRKLTNDVTVDGVTLMSVRSESAVHH